MEYDEQGNNRIGSSNVREPCPKRMKSSYKQHDFISNLPETVLVYILSLLPFKDLVATSALSKRWRYIWTQTPILNLDESLIVKNKIRDEPCPICDEVLSPSSYQCTQHSLKGKTKRFVEFVDRTLLFHSGNTVKKFGLFFQYSINSKYTNKINQWVQFALTSNIEDLELNFANRGSRRDVNIEADAVENLHNANKYNLPCFPFAPRLLRIMKLNYCKFKLSSFKVLSMLQSLHLTKVVLLDSSIGELVSKCPVLEELSLMHCHIPTGFLKYEPELKLKTLVVSNCLTNGRAYFELEISAPHLLSFKVGAVNMAQFIIKNAVHLYNALIDIDQPYLLQGQSKALITLLKCLNHVGSLALSSWCIQALPTGLNQIESLPNRLYTVKQLRLKVGLMKEEFPGISCLLRSCPSLDTLTLDLDEPICLDLENLNFVHQNILDFDEQQYWEIERVPFDCLLNSLKKIEINWFLGTTNEMLMVQFLLRNAMVLEGMIIIAGELPKRRARNSQAQIANYWLQVCSKLLNFPRASSNAQITFHI